MRQSSRRQPETQSACTLQDQHGPRALPLHSGGMKRLVFNRGCTRVCHEDQEDGTCSSHAMQIKVQTLQGALRSNAAGSMLDGETKQSPLDFFWKIKYNRSTVVSHIINATIQNWYVFRLTPGVRFRSTHSVRTFYRISPRLQH